MRMLSEIDLPGTKAPWNSLTKDDIIHFTLLTRHFEMIIYIVLQRPIGLNCDTISGFSTFGMSVINILFTSLNMNPLEKKLSKASHTSRPTTCNVFERSLEGSHLGLAP